MPHTKSAEKSLRKIEKRRMHNRAVKRGLKEQGKAFQAAAEAGNLEELKKQFVLSVKQLDKAAAKKVIHRNTAARRKSQLARLLNQKAAPAKGAAAPAAKS